jgi:hypothetical protein
MSHAVRLALDPQTENEIISAIAALDWNADIVTQHLGIIRNALDIQEKEALSLLLGFQNRRLLICKPDRSANNLAETGVISPPIREGGLGRWRFKPR